MDDAKKTTPSNEGKREEQETRARILAAARSLMSTRGYKGATTRLIAEEASVNEVTIFRHFGNKEGILNAIMDEDLAVGPYLQKSIQGEFASLEEMLRHYGRSFYELLVSNKEILMIYLMEVKCQSNVEDKFSSVPYTAVKVLLNKLQSLQKQGKLPAADIDVAVQMFISSFFYAFMLVHHVGNKDYAITLERLCESAPKILLHGITNPEIWQEPFS